MNRIFILFIAIGLSSCDAPIFSPGLEGAYEVCAANGGVRQIDASPVVWSITVKCNNGDTFKVEDSRPK
jgi:hypothetical protein